MNKFTMLPLEILEDSRLRPLDIVVYAALDSFADSAGEAWPSLRAIAERASKVSSATVKRALSRLENAGYIVRQRRYKPEAKEFDNTLYTLLFRSNKPNNSNNNGGDSSEKTEDSSDKPETGSLEYAGLAPSVREVGSESSRNYNHRTITKEPKKECAEAKKASARSLMVISQDYQKTSPSPLSKIDTEEKEKAKNIEEAPARKPETDRREIESLFSELWERYPRKDYRGEAKKVFMRQFPPGASRETITRRLTALRDKFFVLEEKAEGLLARGKEGFIPCLHKWLVKEDFTDV
ncbi:MAG: helix-turn-helix domain-containing protein [Synergistaceae bacterium]|nr:helix-turn-helix domain-containing protein [Synergistaceae bacterium]